MNRSKANAIILAVTIAWMGASTNLRAAEHEHTDEDTDSEFRLEKGLLDQIYATTVKEQTTSSRSGTLGIGVGLSLMMPSELSLTNSYYEVSWAGNNEVFPMPYVFLGSTFADWGWIALGWSGRIGYSYRESLHQLKLKTGPASSQDLLRMHWASGLGRAEVSFSAPGLLWIRPVLFTGLGGQWIFQIGRLDGANQSFLIPSYAAGAELVFFDRAQYGGHWFSGARVGVTQLAAIAGPQKLNLLSWDFGASFVF